MQRQQGEDDQHIEDFERDVVINEHAKAEINDNGCHENLDRQTGAAFFGLCIYALPGYRQQEPAEKNGLGQQDGQKKAQTPAATQDQKNQADGEDKGESQKKRAGRLSFSRC